MESQAVRMKAIATNFNEIKVLLSKHYYHGISPQFYLKDLERDDLVALSGDALDRHDNQDYQEYIFQVAFELGRVYKVVDAYGLSCYLDFTELSMCSDFDKLYFYDGDDLGSHYTPDETVFKVWSPLATDVILRVVKDGRVQLHPMQRGMKGVYTCAVKADLELAEYHYLIQHQQSYDMSLDPYAYSSTANGRASVVIDLNKVKMSSHALPPLIQKTDAIIYEANVRDFSMSPASGMKNKGKFLALTEIGTMTDNGHMTGLDYLADLGITHLQLMPINDFATVDETSVSTLYNWGYDPSQYNVSEGSYVTQANDGYGRIREVQQMVIALHDRGIRVILDVVYNHMHDINMNALEMTVPHYFFRRYPDGVLSNGSWCGNDMNTTARMTRQYILKMCERWQNLYGIDGYRFDLMGLIDIETMKCVYSQGQQRDSSFLVYGEGWNMVTALPEDQRTTIQNSAQVPEIAFFNDFFRDTMSGHQMSETKGYFSGDTYKTDEAIKGLCHLDMFTHVFQSINYVECHDNRTCYDKLAVTNPDEDEQTRKKRLRMMLAAVILSQGIPFLHSGQEFLRTKDGQHDTYNAGDFINALDWNRRDLEMDTVRFVQFLIRLRKDNSCFRYQDHTTIINNVSLENINHRMIKYQLHQEQGAYNDFIIYFNASLETIDVFVEDGYQILYHSEDGRVQNNSISIDGVCMAILVR